MGYHENCSAKETAPTPTPISTPFASHSLIGIDLPAMKPTTLLPVIVFVLLVSVSPLWSADTKFTPPASPRVTYNFNAGWKFMRAEVPGAQEVSFDDSKWETVSTPHTFNDVDSFRVIRSEEHTSELQSLRHLVCRLLLEKKKKKRLTYPARTSLLGVRAGITHVPLH